MDSLTPEQVEFLRQILTVSANAEESTRARWEVQFESDRESMGSDADDEWDKKFQRAASTARIAKSILALLPPE